MTDCDWAETLYAQGRIYAPSHENHPCTRWITESIANWDWLDSLIVQASIERKLRFERRLHQSARVALLMPRPKLPNIGPTPFAIGFKSETITETDPIKAYRQYYMTEKRHLAKWTRRGKPWWWED
jgi:hypothetical protein